LGCPDYPDCKYSEDMPDYSVAVGEDGVNAIEVPDDDGTLF
jgi:hypothetical protein